MAHKREKVNIYIYFIKNEIIFNKEINFPYLKMRNLFIRERGCRLPGNWHMPQKKNKGNIYINYIYYLINNNHDRNNKFLKKGIVIYFIVYLCFCLGREQATACGGLRVVGRVEPSPGHAAG